ncbi:MAG: Acyl-homoserine lactone [Rhodocyclales bacterium]|nr:Acyl-homoserine lactone [Rhodocyclales bacterium]
MRIQKSRQETKYSGITKMLAIGVMTFASVSAFAQTKLVIPSANVTASSVDTTNIAANAVDNNLNTHWTGGSASGTQWIQFALGSCQKIDYAKLSWYNGNSRHYDYTIKASKDGGATWTVVSAGTSDGLTTALVQIQFSNTSATTMRVESTGNDVNAKVSINEVEFYTLGAGTCSGSSSSSSSAAFTYPAQAFGGLQSWKLDQPTGPSNSSDYIMQPQLATYSNNPYFMLNADGVGVNFRAPAGGSRTSTGTAYARSELREMDSTGANVAAWSCQSASRGMYVEQSLTHTTTHKAETSIAQIHDASNDNVMIKYFGPAYPNANGVSDTGTIKANLNNDTTEYVLDSAYHLGDKMSVDIGVTGGRATVTYHNLSTGLTAMTPATLFTGIVGSCYFKAGVYIAACTKVDLNGSTNTVCVNKGWAANIYETDPNAYTQLEITKINMR